MIELINDLKILIWAIYCAQNYNAPMTIARILHGDKYTMRKNFSHGVVDHDARLVFSLYRLYLKQNGKYKVEIANIISILKLTWIPGTRQEKAVSAIGARAAAKAAKTTDTT